MEPCVFPFVFDGRRFDECTSYLDPNQELWCSTKTNSTNDEHVGGLGHWGICKKQNCLSIKGMYLKKYRCPLKQFCYKSTNSVSSNFFPNETLTGCPFFSLTFGIGEHTKHCSMSFLVLL